MSIANELSSEVAAALLADETDGETAKSSALVEVAVKVHSTLRNLTAEAKRVERRSRQVSEQPGPAAP